MLSRLLATTVLAVVLTGGGAGGGGVAGADDRPPRLHAELVHVGAAQAEGDQFLQADSKGRLVLLRGDHPVFHRLLPSGEARSWGDEDRRQILFESGVPFVLDAAMSPDGTWVLLTPERLFRVTEHKVEILPDTRWRALSVAVTDDPVAAVIPVIEGRVKPLRFDPDAPPLLVELTSSGWENLVEEPFSAEEKAAPETEASLRTFRAVTLAPASAGGLWVANRYLYRLRRFSPAGRSLLDVTLGAHPEPDQLDDEAVEKIRSHLAEQAALLGEKDAVIRPFTIKPAIQAVAEGRDGKLYIYVAEGRFGPEPLLDRYDPVTHRIERATLDLEPPGGVTLAAGHDGLWIAAIRADHEIWRIPWETLDGFAWQTVADLFLDGVAVPK